MRHNILNMTVALAVGVMTLTACNDYLDVDSPSNIQADKFYQTPAQCEQALTGIYNGLLPLPNYHVLMAEGRCDDVWTEPADDKQRDYVDISVFNPNIYTIGTLNSAWNDYYEIIARANLFLEKIQDVEFSVAGVKESFMAEARLLRALAYFDLVRWFGRVPLTLKSLTASEALTLPQSESVEVYDQAIVPDLEYAVENLGETALTQSGGQAKEGRANQIVAKALLGRVYLTMAGFPLYDTDKEAKAEALFKDVIDYADATGKFWAESGQRWPHIWISDNDNRYHIFEIQYVAQRNYGNPAVFLSVPNVGTEYVGIQMSGNRITCSTGLRNLYKEYPDDVRYRYTADPTRHYFTKFFEHKIKRAELGYSDIDAQIVDRTYFPINYPLIRLEDVMLMYAEITGPTAEGVALVNKIRTRAGLPSLSGSELTPDGFAEAVDSERRRELAFEGIRWHDLVRHNKYIECVKAKFEAEIYDDKGNVIHSNYQKYLGNITEGTYIYPIPDTQMKAKPGLYQQNEAYR